MILKVYTAKWFHISALKGSSDAKFTFTFTLLFEHKYVVAVCVHIHPTMIKIHPVLFSKIPNNNDHFLKLF